MPTSRSLPAGLTSESIGDEPHRAVEVRPGLGTSSPQEPIATHDGRHRAISIALVECAHGRVKGSAWHRLLNPGVPVDRETYKKHRLSTELISQAPSFGAIAPELLARLLPANGERVVLVAHNARFDVGVLRTEFELLGHPLPDLPVLDTAGRLVRAVGVTPRDASLDGLLAALGLVNAAPHTATGDASATAAAALELMRRASEHGFAYIPALLEAAGDRRTGEITPVGRIRPARSSVPVMPTEHLERHTVLPAQPTKAEIAPWIDRADDCARLRCPDLGYSLESLVRTARAEPRLVLDALGAVVMRRAAAGDGPGANTALGAVAAAVEGFCPMPAPRGFSGNYPVRRKEAIAIYHRATALVADLPRCATDARCPACQDGAACPRDELARALAPAVLDPKWENGRMTRGSTLLAWLRPDDRAGWFYHHLDPASPNTTSRGGTHAGPLLADATTALLIRLFALDGDEPDRVARARDQVRRMIDKGCADPVLTEMNAWNQAASGRPEHLAATIAECDRALELRPDPGDSAWLSLAVTRDHLAGRLARLLGPQRIADDGSVVPVRRHHPGAKAHRVRPLRFVVV
jgi:DNA polymerase III epsilon subunit-like protein